MVKIVSESKVQKSRKDNNEKKNRKSKEIEKKFSQKKENASYAADRPYYAFTRCEEQRAMPAYEKPLARPVDVYLFEQFCVCDTSIANL